MLRELLIFLDQLRDGSKYVQVGSQIIEIAEMRSLFLYHLVSEVMQKRSI